MKQQVFSRYVRLALLMMLLAGLFAMPQGSALAAFPSAPVNPGFESGHGVGWFEFSSNGEEIIWNPSLHNGLPTNAHTGSWIAYLGDLPNEVSRVYQSIAVDPNMRVTFWYWLNSEETTCGNDVAYVFFNGNVLQSWNLCNSTDTGGWVQGTVNISAYAGQAGYLEFYLATNSNNSVSGMLVDDVAFTYVYDTFIDVQTTDAFLPYIKALYNTGITGGCATNPLRFCPNLPVTRGEMAVFLEKAMGNNAPNPNPTNMFSDVTAGNLFKPFIEELYNDGITSGCAVNPLRYCPNNPVNRGEMAVFIERAIGNTSPNPNPTGMFSDVAQNDPFRLFIEELYNDGITSGCGTNPLRYCPGSVVTRGQMAVFIAKAFNLPLP